jgi:membrane-bound serine protease (ClpP class)
MPEIQSLAELRGRVGQTISPLRPSGVVEFDGRRIDALSEGPMIDAGLWVKCVDVKPGKVFVRLVETNDAPMSPLPPPPPISDPLDDRPPAVPNPPVEKKKLDLNQDDWQIG